MPSVHDQQNRTDAARWIAAEAGFADAQFMLAHHYLLGVGVEKDPATAQDSSPK